jgi:hypothetical protein
MLTVLSIGRCLYRKKATLHKLSTTLLTGVNKFNKIKGRDEKKIHRQKRQPLPRIGSAGLSAYVNAGKYTRRTNHLFLFYLSKTRTSYQQFCLAVYRCAKFIHRSVP